MKKRDYKNFSENSIYHVYNRGNNRECIFHDEQDYRAFLFRLGLAIGIKPEILNKNEITASPKSRVRISISPTAKFKIHSFCLMPNHFHILLEQCSEDKISGLIHKVCTSFSMYINKKYKRVGHVFQDRFKSVLIENNPQLLWTSAYIHMNPVKDKIVANPFDYKWSSYNDFADNRNLPIISRNLIIPTFGSKKNFIKETLSLPKDMSRRVLDISKLEADE